MAFIGSFGITVKGGLERCHRVKDRAVRNGWNRRRLVVAVANPISPSDTGVKAADGSDDLREAYRVWERCARALPDRAHIPVRDEMDDSENTTHVVLKERGRVMAAGRIHWEGQNVRISRVAVLPNERGNGYGKRLVTGMLRMCSPTEGVVYVIAHRWELGFYSILGFDSQGTDEFVSSPKRLKGPQQSAQMFTGVEDLMDNQQEWISAVRKMVYHAPEVQEEGLLHHVTLQVVDIERSLGFYGAIGFTISEKFMQMGCRSCYIEGLGTRIKLEELPPRRESFRRSQPAPHGATSKIVFDVTKKCTDLPGYLSHLLHRSGGAIQITAPPAESVLGSNVVASFSVVDPDNFPLEFIRYQAKLPTEVVTEINW